MNYDLPTNFATAGDGNPQNEYRWAMVAAGIGAIIMAIGMVVFGSNYASRELYHGWYLLAFLVCSVGFAVAFGMRQFGLAVFAIILIVSILGVSLVKFNYRKELLAIANAPGNGTLLGDYVRDIPPFEASYMPYSDQPKWIQFDKNCYRPLAEKAANVAEDCKSKESIQATYNIDILSIIKQRYALMRSTAQQIESKTMTDKAAYEACIAAGTCAEVPLLPTDASIVDMSSSSPEYKDLRTAFWALIDNEQMDASSCEYIPLCKTMFDIGVVKRTDFETLKPAQPAAPATPPSPPPA